MLDIVPAHADLTQLCALTYIFYGANGSGMQPLIEWLIDAGAVVYACDDGKQQSLINGVLWIESLDQAPETINAAVFTTGLPQEHLFFQWAKQRQWQILCSRPRFLHTISKNYVSIAVTGTHGKTNTTTALTWLLEQKGLMPDYIIGGQRCDNSRYGAHLGINKKPYMVFEADESQKTLQYYQPYIGVVLNSTCDHLEFFEQDSEKYHHNIRVFIEQCSIVIIDAATARQRQWALDNAYYIDPGGVQTPQKEYLRFERLVGSLYPLITQTPHAWQFQAAAIALCHALGLDSPEPFFWARYPGVRYRLEILHQSPAVIRDYGHHPKELIAIFDTLRQRYPDKELVLVFQPHKYSRTQREITAFTQVLKLYDLVYLLPTEPAGESFNRSYESDCFMQYLNPATAHYYADWAALEQIRPCEHQVFVFQGAGRIQQYAKKWLIYHQARL